MPINPSAHTLEFAPGDTVYFRVDEDKIQRSVVRESRLIFSLIGVEEQYSLIGGSVMFGDELFSNPRDAFL